MPIGPSGPSLYITQEIQGGHFVIAGGQPGMKVSWQVTGVRQDAYAKAHPISVEQDKPPEEQGYYLHPEAFGQPATKSVSAARNPAVPSPSSSTGENLSSSSKAP